MFNVGGGEMIVIFLVALVVLGPEKLPKTARQIGNIMGELRRYSEGFRTELRNAMDDVMEADARAEGAKISDTERADPDIHEVRAVAAPEIHDEYEAPIETTATLHDNDAPAETTAAAHDDAPVETQPAETQPTETDPAEPHPADQHLAAFQAAAEAAQNGDGPATTGDVANPFNQAFGATVQPEDPPSSEH